MFEAFSEKVLQEFPKKILVEYLMHSQKISEQIPESFPNGIPGETCVHILSVEVTPVKLPEGCSGENFMRNPLEKGHRKK